MSDMTLTLQQYEALISLAREGASDEHALRRLESFLREIESANGIERDIVWVQWQELDQPLPPTVRFPETWPPDQRRRVELVSRNICRADVDAVVSAHATQPTNILCTRDPGATLGWTPIDDFFVI